jgi:probable rRNA maturation factor
MVDVLIRPNLESSLGSKAKTVRHAAQATLDHQDADKQASLCIVLTEDAEIQALNHRYRGIDAPTDVLSFALHEDAPGQEPFVVSPEGGLETECYLGDVIISYPRVLAQAAEHGHRAVHELRLLVVHGVLHLLGNDHATPEDEAQMWAIQDELLKKLEQVDDE